MHLCVSSKYLEVYNMACQFVEELLTNLYKEYDVFCKKTNRMVDPLSLKKIDAFGSSQSKNNNQEIKTPEANDKENLINKPKVTPFYSNEGGYPMDFSSPVAPHG
mmetsp:Transcript_6029/g.5372  ORF Transcript_6029/g.5372 Transcript_6029/m.5372 type:complete len:105 (-) Transcript_6029:1723-2037(-)